MLKRMISVLCFWVLAGPLAGAQGLSKPKERETRNLEGWTVHVDERLLEGKHAALGEKAIRLLDARLADLVLLMPADKVEKLREVPIWLDYKYGKKGGMCYHPNAKWLAENGHEKALVKSVHIQDAEQFTSRHHQQVQPWSVLHELAHAYHDRELGFGEKRIMQAWKDFSASGKYEKCRHINRRDVRHYGLTNQKEFFAEMTEAYFGRNDFYPFLRPQLQDSEPEIDALMVEIWGEKP